MIRTALIALSVVVLLSGCGDDDSTSAGTKDDATTKADTAEEQDAAMKDDTTARADDAMDAAMAAKPRGKVVKVVRSDYGRVIADGKGEAFYLFDKEQTDEAQCYGDCATAWPPVLTKGEPRPGKGATASKLGTTRRRDGRLQVTYAGHPLYYYVHDTPGLIRCHDVYEFGGTWLVVEPSGKAAG